MARLRVCGHVGCPELTSTTRCPAHRMAGRGADYIRNSAHVLTATRCALCGGAFSKDNPRERGHIIALEAGGSNAVDNIRPECRRCNRSRIGG